MIMSSSLAQKIQQAATTATKPAKTKLVKKTATINSVFVDSSLGNMTEHLIKVLRETLINDAIRSLRNKLGDTWFGILYTEDFSKFLSSQYDKLATECRTMTSGSKALDIEGLETVLSEEELEEYKAAHSSSYSFQDIKEYLVLQFGEVSDKAIETLIQFKI